MRGGDMVVSRGIQRPDAGTTSKYVQANAQGYETIKDLLAQFDERAAIIILGHNLLQSVRAAAWQRCARRCACCGGARWRTLKYIQTGCEDLSKNWARANFGTNPADWYAELRGNLPERVSWSLVYDKTDPDERMQAGVRAAVRPGIRHALQGAGKGADGSAGQILGQRRYPSRRWSVLACRCCPGKTATTKTNRANLPQRSGSIRPHMSRRQRRSYAGCMTSNAAAQMSARDGTQDHPRSPDSSRRAAHRSILAAA